MDMVWWVLIFALGVMLGAIISWYARNIEIERALDTIGIRRQDHMKLQRQVDAISDQIWQMKRQMDGLPTE